MAGEGRAELRPPAAMRALGTARNKLYRVFVAKAASPCRPSSATLQVRGGARRSFEAVGEGNSIAQRAIATRCGRARRPLHPPTRRHRWRSGARRRCSRSQKPSRPAVDRAPAGICGQSTIARLSASMHSSPMQFHKEMARADAKHRPRKRAKGAASRVAAILCACDHSTYRLLAELGQTVSAADPSVPNSIATICRLLAVAIATSLSPAPMPHRRFARLSTNGATQAL
jgi:hypothetical protein